MASLSFEGETHGELVVKVRRWLASIDGQEEGQLTAHEAIEQGAELTKEALRIIASQKHSVFLQVPMATRRRHPAAVAVCRERSGVCRHA